MVPFLVREIFNRILLVDSKRSHGNAVGAEVTLELSDDSEDEKELAAGGEDGGKKKGGAAQLAMSTKSIFSHMSQIPVEGMQDDESLLRCDSEGFKCV